MSVIQQRRKALKITLTIRTDSSQAEQEIRNDLTFSQRRQILSLSEFFVGHSSREIMLLYFWAFFFATVPRSSAVFLNRPSQENRKFIDRRTKGEKSNFNFSLLYTKAKMQFAVSATFKCKIASLISRQRACMQSSRLFDRSYRFVRK